MRIAMVGVRGIPARTGGAERVVEQLARHLMLRGHEVLVYCRRGMVNALGTREEGAGGRGQGPGTRDQGLGTRDQGLGNRDQGVGTGEEGVGIGQERRHTREGENGQGRGRLTRIFTAHCSGKHLEAITHTASAVFDALRRGVDVVHVHSPGPALMAWLPALAGRATVLTVHAADWQRDKWHPAARVALRGGLWCGMRWAGAVTAVSASLAGELERRFAREVRFVPNGIEPPHPEPAGRLNGWGLQSGHFLLHVGRIVPEKRLDLLLRCWGQVPQAFLPATGRSSQPGMAELLPWKLVVVGEYADSVYGRACHAAGGPGVIFLGPRYGRELAALYSHAAAIVQPGVLEGMSLVLLEAASYGRCILAADIPANRETLGQAAMFVRPDDAGELTGAIGRCVEREALRREMGVLSLARARQMPSWGAVAEEMEQVYRAAARAEAE